MSDIENPTGDTRPIGVFDSGLGGLTVARAIATVLPRESVYYFGDTKRCPYGTRTEDEVRSFALQAGRWLSKHDVKIMVHRPATRRQLRPCVWPSRCSTFP